jgi:hypothetical protein
VGRRWRPLRWIYFLAGIFGVAVSSAIPPSHYAFWPTVVTALLVLLTAVLASDELLMRIHRIFWRREWPK